uniref:Uncharacterized protein n=1 Tax=Anguilla anguilla TaxID=7936 RepID=A0A0E9QH33_ANGAN
MIWQFKKTRSKCRRSCQNLQGKAAGSAFATLTSDKTEQ